MHADAKNLRHQQPSAAISILAFPAVSSVSASNTSSTLTLIYGFDWWVGHIPDFDKAICGLLCDKPTPEQEETFF